MSSVSDVVSNCQQFLSEQNAKCVIEVSGEGTATYFSLIITGFSQPARGSSQMDRLSEGNFECLEEKFAYL